MATNRAANKRLITQLSIEAKERSHERELSLRKEVYLKAAEEMTRAQQFLSELSKGNIGKLDTRAWLDGFSSSTSKIHIVGTDDTIRAVVGVMGQFSTSVLRLMALAIPLDELKTDIEILSKSIDDNSVKRERFLNEMTEFNLRADKDKQRWSALQSNFDYVHSEIQNDVDERSKKWNEHNSYQRKFSIECIKDSIELGKLAILTVISIRKELNLPFDEESYKTLMHDQMVQLESMLGHFMKNLENSGDS